MNNERRWQDMLQKDVVSLLHREPFYGHILVGMTKVFDTHMKYCAGVSVHTNIALYINPAQYFEIEEKLRVGILKHEILHVILKHILRSKDLPLKNRANVAGDLAINPIVGKDNLPNWVLFPALYELPDNLTMEQYYTRLPESKVILLMGSGSGDLIPEGYKQIDEHDWEELSPLDEVLAEVIVDDAVRKATKHAGTVPGEIKDLIHYKEKAVIPWQTVLKRFLGNARANITWTKKRYSKRYQTRPGTKLAAQATIAIAVDTSGSIEQEYLDRFMTEAATAAGHADIWCITCDYEIHEIIHPFSKSVVRAVTGRGGTNFCPPIEWAGDSTKGHPPIDAMIYLTDMYGPAPERAPRFPILWCLTPDGDHDIPYGQKIVLPEELKE